MMSVNSLCFIFPQILYEHILTSYFFLGVPLFCFSFKNHSHQEKLSQEDRSVVTSSFSKELVCLRDHMFRLLLFNRLSR